MVPWTLLYLRLSRYPSEELPEKELLCSKLLDAEEAKDQLWAVHVPVGQGAAKSGENAEPSHFV